MPVGALSQPSQAIASLAGGSPQGLDVRRRLAGKSAQEVAHEFEALMVSQVVSAMRKTIPESGTLEASAARRVFDGAFDQEIARALTVRGDFGIARQLTRQIEKQQGLTTTSANVASTQPRVDAATATAPARTTASAPNLSAGADARPLVKADARRTR